MVRWLPVLALAWVACPAVESPVEEPAPVVDATTRPQAPLPEVAPGPDEVVLLAAIQGMLVPLARTCDGMEGGGACDDDVPVGGEVGAVDGSAAVLGEPALVVCPVEGGQATAFPVEGRLTAPVYFWPRSGVDHWVAGDAQEVDEAVRERALEALTEANFGFRFYPERSEGAVVHRVLSVDLDGDGAEDPVTRVFMGSSDPDDPGHSVLYWGSDLHPMSNRALELNGRVDALGALATPFGTVLVIADDWRGGSGVHAFTVFEGELRLLGEWSCGT